MSDKVAIQLAWSTLLWKKRLMERFVQEVEWQKIQKGMMPYARWESWQSSLNRFVGYLNSESEKKLHPERYYEGSE